MKRLRVGISLPFARNALVLARTVAPDQVAEAWGALMILEKLGFKDGARVGSGLLSGTIVARLEDY